MLVEEDGNRVPCMWRQVPGLQWYRYSRNLIAAQYASFQMLPDVVAPTRPPHNFSESCLCALEARMSILGLYQEIYCSFRNDESAVAENDEVSRVRIWPYTQLMSQGVIGHQGCIDGPLAASKGIPDGTECGIDGGVCSNPPVRYCQ